MLPVSLFSVRRATFLALLSYTGETKEGVRKMRKILLGWLVFAGAMSAADVSGKWASATLYLILKQDGSRLTGSAGPSEKEQILTLSSGSVEGDRIAFKMGSFQLDLEVNGDGMKGEMKNAAGSTPVFLKRVTERPAAGRRTFEVASVKRAPPPTGNGINSSMRLDPGRLTCSNVSLKKLIYESYGVKDYQVSGPDWLGTEIYDITATVPPGVTRDDVQAMIQSLLADRFQLALHRDTREMPVLALVVGKSGPKLQEVEFARGSTSASAREVHRRHRPDSQLHGIPVTANRPPGAGYDRPQGLLFVHPEFHARSGPLRPRTGQWTHRRKRGRRVAFHRHTGAARIEARSAQSSRRDSGSGPRRKGPYGKLRRMSQTGGVRRIYRMRTPKKLRVGVCAVSAAVSGGRAFRAGSGSRPAFEVASVKPAQPPTAGKILVYMGGDPGMVDYKNVSLKSVIARAYEMKEYQVSGPAWLDSARFDILAKTPPNTPKEQIPAMLRNLLAERFQLSAHLEQKVMPAFAMLVGKSGFKLKPLDGETEDSLRMSIGPRGRQISGSTTIANLAGSLAQIMDRPVADLTEIKGTYNIDLEWVPDELEGGGVLAKMKAMAEAASTDPHGDPTGPTGLTIFGALQEKLGIRLESRKSPVAIVVVDSVRQAPTEN